MIYLSELSLFIVNKKHNNIDKLKRDEANSLNFDSFIFIYYFIFKT